MEIELAQMYEEAERFDEGIHLLSRLLPPLEVRLDLYDPLVIVSKMMMAKAIFETGLTDEAISMLASLYTSLAEELGFEDSMTKRVENVWINALIDLERWSAVDEKMEMRFARLTDDADLLLKLAENIIDNGHKGYRERYFDMALKATQRAVFVLAKVHYARGEYLEASNWYAKSIAFADEDNEDIEMYRTKLQEVTAYMKDTVVE
jgi:tetratricopeptide (TPR) repeat protein